MLKSKRLKGIFTVVITAVLVILLAAGTGVVVNKRNSVQSSVTVKNGLSAYELAVKNGYNGTVTDWLKSLEGSRLISRHAKQAITARKRNGQKALTLLFQAIYRVLKPLRLTQTVSLFLRFRTEPSLTSETP